MEGGVKGEGALEDATSPGSKDYGWLGQVVGS